MGSRRHAMMAMIGMASALTGARLHASALERLFVGTPKALDFFAPAGTATPAAAPPDHRAWQAWLDRFLVVNHPSAIHRVRYGAVDPPGRTALAGYLRAMQAIDPRRLARDEQLAYWINLYNAVTVQVILDHPGVRSIRDIKSGLFSVGPWQLPLARVDGQSLSLDAIEHRIVRPLFRDRRVHFALNCASLGCPDLAARAFTGATIDADLAAAQRTFLAHPRAIRFSADSLVLSSLFDWYREDFAAAETGVIKYLAANAPAATAARLQAFRGTISYAYDWSLNGAP